MISKIQKGQLLGRQRVEEVRQKKMNHEMQKLEQLTPTKGSRNVELDQKIKTNKLVAKHYGILKRLHTRQFQRDVEAGKKRSSMQEKLEGA